MEEDKLKAIAIQGELSNVSVDFSSDPRASFPICCNLMCCYFLSGLLSDQLEGFSLWKYLIFPTHLELLRSMCWAALVYFKSSWLISLLWKFTFSWV